MKGRYSLTDIVNNARPICVIVICIFGILRIAQDTPGAETSNSETKGCQLVKCLYEFENISELDETRDEQLKSLVTDNVYDELTFDNEGRMLSTYLKLKSDPVKVVIVKDTEDVVLYRLETEKISSDRLFALVYEVNDNKISYVREMECIDFVTTSD